MVSSFPSIIKCMHMHHILFLPPFLPLFLLPYPLFFPFLSFLFPSFLQSKSAQTLGTQLLVGLCSIHSLSYREAILKALQQQSHAMKASVVEVTSLVRVEIGLAVSLDVQVYNTIVLHMYTCAMKGVCCCQWDNRAQQHMAK